MSYIVRSLLSLCLIIACAGSSPRLEGSAAATTDQQTLIQHVTLIEPADGSIRADASILIRNGRIVRTGTISKATLAPGTDIIDGTGLFAIPGLADMHVHFWDLRDCKLFAAAGVTTVRNLLKLDLDEWKNKIAAGYPGPTIYTAVMLDLAGGPWLDRGGIGVTTPAEARDAVRQIKRNGYPFVKTYDALTREMYDAILEEAAEVNIPVVGHIPAAVPIEHAVAKGQYGIEHMSGLSGEVFQENGALIPERAAELAQLLAQADVWVCPTITLYRKFMPLSDYAEAVDVAGTEHLSMERKLFWSLRPRPAEQAYQYQNSIRQCVALLHRAGVNIVAGTDVGNPFMVPGYSLHEELENLVAAGMTHMEALQAATSQAATFINKEGEFGTLRPGARADIVLLRANPLEDIANTREIEMVFLRGTLYDREAINADMLQPEKPVNNFMEQLLYDLRVGDTDSAIRDYRRKLALQETDDIPEAFHLRVIATRLNDDGRRDDARAVAGLGLELYPENGELSALVKALQEEQ